MQIQSDETIGQFVTRLEREATERLALVATIRKMMPSEGAINGNGRELPRPASSTKKPKRNRKRMTLADNIAAILKNSPEPMTQPQIRDALYARGTAQHLKNPLSAISTAMSRQEKVRFERGDGFTWKLVGGAKML